MTVNESYGLAMLLLYVLLVILLFQNSIVSWRFLSDNEGQNCVSPLCEN